MTAALIVDGLLYEGWTSVGLQRSMEQLAHGFKLSFSDRWTDAGEALPIEEGATCKLEIDGVEQLDGYVDESSIRDDPETITMSVTGRSKVADLVDCSVEIAGGQWRGADLATIATEIAEQQNVGVVDELGDTETYRRFAVQMGETGFEAIERAARARGALLLSNAGGDLVITKAGNKRTATRLERGVNINRGSRRGSMIDRYSSIRVLSQVSGDKETNGPQAAHVLATSSDERVPRHRPLTIIAESQMSKAQAQRRADWERNIRYGRAQRLTYTIPGWENAEGVWDINTLVHVVDPLYRVDDELLIASVSLDSDSDNESVTLGLVRPESFDVEQTPPKARVADSFFGQKAQG